MCHQCCISSGFFYYLNCYTTSSKRFSRSLLSQSEIIALLRSNLCAMAKQIYQPCDAYLTDVIAPCKGIQDSLDSVYSTPGIPDSTYWIPRTLSVELGFWNPKVSGIPDSLSCIPDSTAQDSAFRKQKFPGFRNTESPYIGRTLDIVQSDRAYSQHIA